MEKVEAYLRDELHLREVDLRNRLTEFERHPDIANEFEIWIESREYPLDGIMIEGFTAKDIQERANFTNGALAYNFLITLREKPERAMQYINEGFPRG